MHHVGSHLGGVHGGEPFHRRTDGGPLPLARQPESAGLTTGGGAGRWLGPARRWVVPGRGVGCLYRAGLTALSWGGVLYHSFSTKFTTAPRWLSRSHSRSSRSTSRCPAPPTSARRMARPGRAPKRPRARRLIATGAGVGLLLAAPKPTSACASAHTTPGGGARWAARLSQTLWRSRAPRLQQVRPHDGSYGSQRSSSTAVGPAGCVVGHTPEYLDGVHHPRLHREIGRIRREVEATNYRPAAAEAATQQPELLETKGFDVEPEVPTW